MEAIRAIITDDDIFTCEQLKDKIRLLVPQLEIIAVCENSLQGIEAIKKLKPQLVFLDIQMPGLSGFEMLDHLDQNAFEVIFITSFNQFAIQAIRYSALDYLLKPIKDSELVEAINRFVNKKESLSLKSRMQNLNQNFNLKNVEELSIIIPTRQGERNLLVSQIIRCEADSNYTHFYLNNSTVFTSSRTLKEYEYILSEHQFIRIHKSHIINRNYVERITNDQVLVLKNNSTFDISRRRIAEVKKALNK